MEQAWLLIIKGQIRLMDITKITFSSRPDPIYSFLSIAWWIISDVDLESEKVRWMGDTRFTLWSIIRMLKLRRYRAVLSYRGGDITHKDQNANEIGVDFMTSSNDNNWNFNYNDEEVEESKLESKEEVKGSYWYGSK